MRNKSAHIVVGVDCDGVKHVLGIWVQATEAAKFWLSVCTELRNRGVRDVLIACCDGLPGLPEAIETIWPATTVQTSSIHNGRAEIVSVVTCTAPGRTCADASPFEVQMQTCPSGAVAGFASASGSSAIERRDEVPTRPASVRWPKP